LAIFRNLTRNISSNYKANETEPGSLLEHARFSQYEKLTALGRSLGEGMALKLTLFEKSAHVWRHLVAQCVNACRVFDKFQYVVGRSP